MLNPSLYQSLQDVFGQEPEISNADMEGVFSCPPVSKTRLSRKEKRMAQVSHWGETYSLNCPVCGDKRRRLYFSHLFDGSTKANNVTYYFGKLYCCQNEKCNLYEYIKKLDTENVVVSTKPQTFTGMLLQDTVLPSKCIPLLSSNVPERILEYLYQRKFDPQELANKHFIHVALKGTKYQMRGEEKEFFDDRIIIPVLQGRRLVGWQARRCQDLPKDKYKYLNSAFQKSMCLYNRDNAMYCRDITIVEGVTDCWRIGQASIALFGKDPSIHQIRLMKLLWGFSGSAVVCFDTDDKSASVNQRRLVEKLRKEQVFPRGVSSLSLPAGSDPASTSKQNIEYLIQEARQQCR